MEKKHMRVDGWTLLIEDTKCTSIYVNAPGASISKPNELPPGTLLCWEGKFCGKDGILCDSPDRPGMTVKCFIENQPIISQKDANWLFPLTLDNRIRLYNSRALWNHLTTLQEGALIEVRILDDKICKAEVIGEVHNKTGTQYAVRVWKDTEKAPETAVINLGQIVQCRNRSDEECTETSLIPTEKRNVQISTAFATQWTKEGITETTQAARLASRTEQKGRESSCRLLSKTYSHPETNHFNENPNMHHGSSVKDKDPRYTKKSPERQTHKNTVDRERQPGTEKESPATMNGEFNRLPGQTNKMPGSSDLKVASGSQNNTNDRLKEATSGSKPLVPPKLSKPTQGIKLFQNHPRQSQEENIDDDKIIDNNDIIISHTGTSYDKERLPPETVEFTANMLSQDSSNKKGERVAETSSFLPDKTLALKRRCLGKLVEVNVHGQVKKGIVRYLNVIHGKKTILAGLEMEEQYHGGGDGTYSGQKCFHCQVGRSLFVDWSTCTPVTTESHPVTCCELPILGKGFCKPGREKGIQGHYNSCYLDATLFCMFAFNSTFDNILTDHLHGNDNIHQLLFENIVNPLRKDFFVQREQIMELREYLDTLDGTHGMTREEKDPEEFLTVFLDQALRCDHFIHLSSNQGCYFYPIICEKHTARLPTIQQLLNKSFLESGVKMIRKPKALIIQLPRMGSKFRMYDMVFPSHELIVNDVIEDVYQSCVFCGKAATKECKVCSGTITSDKYRVHGLFCETCYSKRHRHNHDPTVLASDVRTMQNADSVRMELYAVLCINISHYIAYVKCDEGSGAPWVFFDSMADRIEYNGGENIPEVKTYEDLGDWLNENGFKRVLTSIGLDIPDHVRRLLTDGYFFFYRNISAKNEY